MIRYPKLIKFFAIFLFISAFVLIVSLSLFKITDFDTMHKLANGRLIVEKGFTKDCVFNYSKDDCQTIFMVEWLFHVLIFVIYSIGSWNGLVIFQSLIIIALFSAIFFDNIKSKNSWIASSIIIFLSSLVTLERFMLRSDLFALLLAVLFYIVLKKYESQGKNIFLFFLILLQILWANIHGSFPVAYFIVLCFLGPHVLKTLWENFYQNRQYLNKKNVFLKIEIKRLGLAFILIVLASLVNPYGISAFVGVINYLTEYSPVLRAQIKEFRSVFEPRDFEYFTVKMFKILTLISLSFFALNYKKIKLRDFLVLAGFIFLAVTSIRNIALFSVFAALILPFYLDNLILFIKGVRKKKILLDKIYQAIFCFLVVGLIFFANWLTFQVITNQFYEKEQSLRRFGFGVSEISYPFKAADFIEQNNISGNMFNNFSLGSFLNWQLFPQRKTFIDNHTWTIEWLRYYDKIVNGLEPVSEVSEKYDINYFILTHLSGDTLFLIESLYNDPKWVLIYFDELAVIFIKAKPDNLDIMKNFAIDLESGGYDPDNLNFENKSSFSRGYSNRGIFLANLGFLEQALYQYKKGLEVSEKNYNLYHNIGLAYFYLDDYENAEESYLKSIQIKSNFAPVHYNLAILYHKTNRIDQALIEYKKTLKINRGYRLASYHLGIIYEEKGEFDKAKNYYQKELKINPNLTVAKNSLNRLEKKISPNQNNLNTLSIENLIEQIKINPDNADLYFELGLAYGLEEKHNLAFEQFKKTIELNPNHFMARLNLANFYSLQGKHEEAEKEYLMVIEFNSKIADPYLNLGIIYRYHKRDNQKALENWQKFLELAPNDPQAENIKQEINQIIQNK